MNEKACIEVDQSRDKIRLTSPFNVHMPWWHGSGTPPWHNHAGRPWRLGAA